MTHLTEMAGICARLCSISTITRTKADNFLCLHAHSYANTAAAFPLQQSTKEIEFLVYKR